MYAMLWTRRPEPVVTHVIDKIMTVADPSMPDETTNQVVRQINPVKTDVFKFSGTAPQA